MIGVPHELEQVTIPCLKSSFKEMLSKTLGVRRNIWGREAKSSEYKGCLLNLLCDFYGTGASYDSHRSTFLSSYKYLSPKHHTFIAYISSVKEPETYHETIQNKRLEAMMQEIELQVNNTWEVVDLPHGKTPNWP